MDLASFYGSSSCVNVVPGDGFVSDDEYASHSDTENDYIPAPSDKIRRHLRSMSKIESSSSDDEVERPISSSRTSVPKGKKKAAKSVIWRKGKMAAYDKTNFQFLGNSEWLPIIEDLDSPADFFKYLFTDDLIDMIVYQSNMKSVQDNVNRPSNITKEEMEQFIGIVIFMSLVRLPASRSYWSKGTGQHQVYDVMTLNRFEVIKSFLHFNNNEDFKPRGTLGHDKLFKIRPLLTKIRERLMLVPKEEYLAVDEQIIPTKSRHEIKQYNPAKPHKWGYKNFVLSGVSGFSYDFDIFAGEQSNSYPDDAPDLGVSGNVVTRLTSTVPRHQNHKVFFDNWFNSPGLQVHMYKNGLLPLGTVRLNRVPNSNMPTAAQMKKLGRGSMEEKTATIDNVKLSLVSWFDNKPVNLLSAYVGSEPITKRCRYVRKAKKYIDINCPQSVEVYNQYMGGVDLLDSMLGYYRIHLRSRKWYKRIFFHMIDLCIVNAWLLWRRKSQDYLPLFDFKLAISEHLRLSGKSISKKRGRPSTASMTNVDSPISSRLSTPTRQHSVPGPSKKPRKAPKRHQELPLNSVRTDKVDHFPTWMKNRQLCQNCSSYRSFTMCQKCNTYLCYNEKRNCFKDFHIS